MKILHNHLGYQTAARKIALMQSSTGLPSPSFTVYDADTREAALRGNLDPRGEVAQWRDWQFWEADFSALDKPGSYMIALDGTMPPVVSQTFEIAGQLYDGQIVSNLVHYLKSQRCTGVFDIADRSRPKYGSTERADVHGGWYDASGD